MWSNISAPRKSSSLGKCQSHSNNQAQHLQPIEAQQQTKLRQQNTAENKHHNGSVSSGEFSRSSGGSSITGATKQTDALLSDDTNLSHITQVSSDKTDTGAPLMRYKHAACSAPTGYIYVHGGRFGNLPLDDDIWRFDAHQNVWSQLHTSGCKPPTCLQEHTLLEWNNQLYLFGGQLVSSSSGADTAFWRLDLATNQWHEITNLSSRGGAHLGPSNRRAHSAVIYNDSMYIFGGYEDLRGSSCQLWQFDLNNERWELRNLSSTSAIHPEPRHSHSAVVYEHSMLIYGGLSNLKPLSDLWRWSWHNKRWYKERTRGESPGALHGHSAICAFGSMFVFGGERGGRATRGLWRLNLANYCWQKIKPKGPKPMPMLWHAATANPLDILDETNYLIESSGENVTSIHATGEDDCDDCRLMLTSEDSNGVVATELSQRESKPTSRGQQKTLQSVLSHSKSSSSWLSMGLGRRKVTRSALEDSSQPSKRFDRLARLTFLRRTRNRKLSSNQSTARSSFELKGISSTDNVKSEQILEDSCENVQKSASTNEFPSTSDAPAITTPDQHANRILDSLDTDIKRMFSRVESNTINEEDQMSVDVCHNLDEINAANQSNRTSTATLQYRSARSELPASAMTSVKMSQMQGHSSTRTSLGTYATANESIPAQLSTSFASSTAAEIDRANPIRPKPSIRQPAESVIRGSDIVMRRNTSQTAGHQRPRPERPRSEIMCGRGPLGHK